MTINKKGLLVSTTIILSVVAILFVVFVFSNIFTSVTDIDQLAQIKILKIRNTKNTDISNRTGKIYYLSPNGNDTNDGLSKECAWKSLSKVNEAFNKKKIVNGDTILFQRGEEFRGNINVTACDVLIGSYGDESKAKPQILVSPYNGAIQGEWIEVLTNIWHYTIDGCDPFVNDVGVIWCFSDGESKYAQKITNNQNADETQIDLAEILTNDLEFYHFGHASSREATGGALYLYSTSNPQRRFDDIEFCLGKNGIRFGNYTDLHVDNVTIKYAGNHGIGGGTVANLKVTNCELGYIGGAMQYYKEENGSPVRFGNAIEIYGSVTETKGYTVKDGFVVDNNYIYQVYDAGITFQITTENNSKIERVVFSNNLVEYCNYDIEYWNTSKSLDETIQANTYINYYKINHNLMRYAGCGVCTTRPDKGRSCIIKTWEHSSKYDNRVVGNFIIDNNIFSSPTEQMFCISASDENSLPQVTNNQFYASKDVPFGYYYVSSAKVNYPFSKQKLNKYFPSNEFNYLEKDFGNQIFTGTSGDLNWKLCIASGTLTIDGVGQMADYTSDNLPEWYDYKSFINKIIIGEKVTKLGKYAFYKLPYVEELEINAINLENLSRVGNNDGDNFTFYQTGKEWIGISVTFGVKVTRVPSQIFWPALYNDAPKIINLEFEGVQVKEIGDHAFLNLCVETINIPEGVEKIGTLAFSGASAKVIVLPESVNTLGTWVFSGCKYVEKIILSSQITKIGVNTFNKTNNLKQLIIPGNVTYTGSDYANLFSTESDTIVYGNETVHQLINNYCIATGTNNIKYANIKLVQ